MHGDATPPVVVGTASPLSGMPERTGVGAGRTAQGLASCRHAVQVTTLLGRTGISAAYWQLSHNRQEATQPRWAEQPSEAIQPSAAERPAACPGWLAIAVRAC